MPIDVKPQTLERARSPLADPERQRAILNAVSIDAELDSDFDARIAMRGAGPLRATEIDVLQLNLGKVCNQVCVHCHVDAGPDRRESMDRSTAELCMRALERSDIPRVDITGGAPELNPNFRYLVEESRRLGRRVMDRCNLTILEGARGDQLVEFLRRNEVEVVASLPHYRAISTDRQRGDGVFESSINGLLKLNAAGYGVRPELRLDLVTNPVGAFLPAGQASLEAEWKRELERRHDVVFNSLFTITNMPISRYLQWLQSSGNLDRYLSKLVELFNPAAVAGLMCRTTLSVAWDGRLHDCDFNQMLELGLEPNAPQHIADFDAQRLAERRIATGRHCFGCTAGAGSSCGGSLAEVAAV